MKTIKTIILLLVCTVSCGQIGIETTNPTNTLDVNGGARVRNLQEGTVQSDAQGNLFSLEYKVYAFVVIEKDGTILRQLNVSSVQKTASNKYRVFFTTPMADNDYIILGMGKNRTLNYDAVSNSYVDITVSVTNGQFDFNVMIIDLI